VDAVVAPSQGVHIVLDKSFLARDTAIMVPKTDDGRVLFVIPWHDRALVGTTDVEMKTPELEPRPRTDEIEFVLRNAARYMEHDPRPADILSVFAGQRPLVRMGGIQETKKISREHVVEISRTGLVSIMGGKWTTYRKMAEDTVYDAAQVAGLPVRACVTQELRLHGWLAPEDPALPPHGPMRMYGGEADRVRAFLASDPAHEVVLHPRLPYVCGQLRWAVRNEQARTVEDLLSRRTRSLVLDARAAIEAAPRAAALLADELGRDAAFAQRQLDAFLEVAGGYLPPAELLG
jgi:glycerol-3-phosphate dehydrogenase